MTGGLRDGRTLGSPLVLEVVNLDWQNWSAVMDPWQVDAEAAAKRAVTRPRPGHADYSGGAATDQLADMRNVLERSSARETAARVAAGSVCAQLLDRYGVSMRSAVLRVGPHEVLAGRPDLGGPCGGALRLAAGDPETGRRRSSGRSRSRGPQAGETMGGVVGAVVRGLPPGLGSCVHWDRKLDGRLAQALVSIHSVKAASLGDGLEVASLLGSQAHDPYELVDGRLERTGNRAGGLEGGVTNGADLVVRAFFKPISTLRRGLPSVDLSTAKPGEHRLGAIGRHRHRRRAGDRRGHAGPGAGRLPAREARWRRHRRHRCRVERPRRTPRPVVATAAKF